MMGVMAGTGIYSASKSGKDAKGGGLPSLSKEGKWAQGELYNIIGRGMGGGGLYPSGYGRTKAAYTKSYREALPEYQSQINRIVPRGDVKVRDYMSKILPRTHQSLMLSLKEQESMRPFQEQQQATELGFESLAGEKRMGISYANMANESAMRMASMPTFSSELGYGLGRATGWMSAAERYAQGMAGGLK
jgi:hypothetical protein